MGSTHVYVMLGVLVVPLLAVYDFGTHGHEKYGSGNRDVGIMWRTAGYVLRGKPRCVLKERSRIQRIQNTSMLVPYLCSD